MGGMEAVCGLYQAVRPSTIPSLCLLGLGPRGLVPPLPSPSYQDWVLCPGSWYCYLPSPMLWNLVLDPVFRTQSSPCVWKFGDGGAVAPFSHHLQARRHDAMGHIWIRTSQECGIARTAWEFISASQPDHVSPLLNESTSILKLISFPQLPLLYLEGCSNGLGDLDRADAALNWELD